MEINYPNMQNKIFMNIFFITKDEDFQGIIDTFWDHSGGMMVLISRRETDTQIWQRNQINLLNIFNAFKTMH